MTRQISGRATGASSICVAIKSWLAAMAVACVMVLALCIAPLTAFAAGAKITFSDPSVTVGSSVTVTMKVAGTDKLESADIMLSYDSGALEFVSGTDAEGGAGAVRVHGNGGTPGSGTMTFSLQFNALTAGTTKINITSQEIYDTASKLVTVDHQGSSAVTVGALQTASKDATLKSLQVSPGQLSPSFSPDVDTYAVTVGTDVDKLVISAECTDENATNVVSGNENLQMGENRVSCKVVAQDGETSKEYIIVVTKQEGGASETSDSQFKMRVSERTITVLEPDASLQIPDGFKESTIKIDGHSVTGWVWGAETEHQYCVIYGMNEAGEKDFYRYDMKDTERTIQRYFADPAAENSVSQDVYTQLAGQYDSLRKDYSLFRILLIAAIVIAMVLLVLVVILAASRKGNGGDGGSKTKNRRAKNASGAARGTKPVREENVYDEDEDENDQYEEDEDVPEDVGQHDEDDRYDGQYPEEENFVEDREEEPQSWECSEEETEYEPEAEIQEEPEPEEKIEEASESEEVVYEEPAYEEPVSEEPARKPEKPSREDDDDFEIFDL